MGSETPIPILSCPEPGRAFHAKTTGCPDLWPGMSGSEMAYWAAEEKELHAALVPGLLALLSEALTFVADERLRDRIRAALGEGTKL